MGRNATGTPEQTYGERFAANLKRLRLRKKLTGKQAAQAITEAGYQCEWRTFYDWEAGNTFPSVNALPAISKALGVSIRSLFPIS